VIIFLITIFFSVNSIATEQEAISHIKKLGKSLKSELVKAMKVNPQEAVKVCNTNAAKITSKISNKTIQVGRVSRKLRNPNNKIQKWMEKYIQELEAKKIDKKYITVNISETKRGILMPIKTQGVCLKCHGKNISKNLHSTINELYPSDQAIGYKMGEIRGYFWAQYESL
jgi:hypothetical protein